MSCVELECVICSSTFVCGARDNNVDHHVSCEQLKNPSTQQLKLGLSLLCKLLNVNVGKSVSRESSKNNNNDELYKLLEEFATGSLSSTKTSIIGGSSSRSLALSTCDRCSEAMQEILRLERIIEDLKVSQMVHANMLKRSLLVLKTNYDGSKSGNQKRKDYCKVIRSQLIACLMQDQKNPVPPSPAKRFCSDKTDLLSSDYQLNDKSGRRKPRKQLISGKKTYEFDKSSLSLSGLPHSHQTIDTKTTVLKPCFVKLTRLGVPAGLKPKTTKKSKNSKAPKTVSSIFASFSSSASVAGVVGRRRPIRQSSQKANDLLRNTLLVSSPSPQDDNCTTDLKDPLEPDDPLDEDWQANDDELNLSSEQEDNLDNFSLPTATDDIKQETIDDDYLDAADDFEWNKAEHLKKGREKQSDKNVSKKETKLGKRMCFLAENLYMYNCSLIKFCVQERRFICQEPDCCTVLAGTMLDASLFKNIRAHVGRHHMRSVFKPDGKSRSCPLCSVEIKGGRKRFRNHIALFHRDITKGMRTVVCETCGKYGFSNAILEHKWTHKSFQEKVAHYQAGEKFPAALRLYLKKKPWDPFYSVIFGEADVKNSISSQVASSSNAELAEDSKSSSPPVYHLQNNFYFHKFTIFEYRQEQRVFLCQEPGCLEKIPDWKDFPVLQIRDHVSKTHSNNSSEDFVRSCPLCSVVVQGCLNFQSHVTTEHMRAGFVLCEVCTKPLLPSEHYLSHVRTHKGNQRYVVDVQPLEAAKPVIRRNKTKNLFYVVSPSTLLFKCTEVTVQEQGYRLVCRDPGCDMTFQAESLMDFYGLLEQVKTHVNICHEKMYRFDRLRPCPMCAKTFLSALEMRVHFFTDHLNKDPHDMSVAVVVCQVCLKPMLNTRRRYQNHMITHMNKSDKKGITEDPPPCSEKIKRALEIPKPISKLDFVYILPRNTYLYRHTVFSYSENERLFTCQEDNCCEEIPGWSNDVVVQIKGHVHNNHFSAWNRPSEECVRVCPLCLEEVRGLHRFHNHLLEDHRDEELTGGSILCEICLKPLSSSEDYSCHLRTHDQIQDDNSTGTLMKRAAIICPTCGKTFSKKWYLKLHLAKHQEYATREKFPCPHCPAQLLSKHTVKVHVERVHQPRQGAFRKCTVAGCEKMFYRRDHTRFKDHLRTHKGLKPYICDLCGKGFHSNTRFLGHKKLVHGPKKFQCDKCGTKFTRNCHLKRHKDGKRACPSSSS